MSKIEEGDACDKFMSDIVPFVLPIAQILSPMSL